MTTAFEIGYILGMTKQAEDFKPPAMPPAPIRKPQPSMSADVKALTTPKHSPQLVKDKLSKSLNIPGRNGLSENVTTEAIARNRDSRSAVTKTPYEPEWTQPLAKPVGELVGARKIPNTSAADQAIINRKRQDRANSIMTERQIYHNTGDTGPSAEQRRGYNEYRDYLKTIDPSKLVNYKNR